MAVRVPLCPSRVLLAGFYPASQALIHARRCFLSHAAWTVSFTLWLASGCLGAPPERLSQEHVKASGVMTNAAPFQSRGSAGQAALGRVAKGRGRRRDEAYAVLLRACGRMALPAQVKDNAVSPTQSTT